MKNKKNAYNHWYTRLNQQIEKILRKFNQLVQYRNVVAKYWYQIGSNKRKFKKSSHGKRILQFGTDINAPLRLEHKILALTLARERLVVSEN